MKNMALWRSAARWTLAALAVLALTGCAGTLPKKYDRAISSFRTFEDARAGYDKVVVGATTLDQLKTIGYDPDKTANIQQLTYLQVLQAFLPRQDIPFSTMPPSVQSCVETQTRCTGYAINPKVTDSRRVGSVFLDVFNFRRKTIVTGWQADALFVLLDNVVVYKMWSGEPNIDTTTVSINPLGPLQDLGGAFGRVIPSPSY